MNVTTYNNFIAVLKDIADRHYQINSFGIGQNFDIEASTNVNYPLLWVKPIKARMTKGSNEGYATFDINFELKVIDQATPDNTTLVNKVGSMTEEIYNDTLEVLKDIITEIDGHPYYQNSGLQIINDVDFNPLNEYTDHNLNGWVSEIELRSKNTRSFCGIPVEEISGFSFPGPDYTGLTYIDVQYITDIINSDGNIQVSHTGTTYEVNASGITTNTNNITQLDNNKYDKSGGTISGDVQITGQTYFQKSVYFSGVTATVNAFDTYISDLSQSNIFILDWVDTATLDYSNPRIGTYIWVIQNQTALSILSFETNKFASAGGTYDGITGTIGAVDIINGVYDGTQMIISIGNDIQII